MQGCWVRGLGQVKVAPAGGRQHRLHPRPLAIQPCSLRAHCGTHKAPASPGWSHQRQRSHQKGPPSGRLRGGRVLHTHAHADSAPPQDSIITAAKTSMSSKIVGSDADFFSQMAVDAIQVRAWVLASYGRSPVPSM